MGPGGQVKVWRKRQGLTQRQFAAALTAAGMPVDASRVSRVESGEADLRFSEALIVCGVLGCTPNDLAGLAGEAERATARRVAEEIDFAIQQLHQIKEGMAA